MSKEDTTTRRFEQGFHQDFREKLKPGLERFGVGPSTTFQMDRLGMLIKLAANRKREDGAGVATLFRVSGDFEITVSYDILFKVRPTKGFGAGMKTWMQIGESPKRRVTFAHLRRPHTENEIVALIVTSGTEGKKSTIREKAETDATRGRLRFARNGSVLTLFVADGESDEFREFSRAEVGTEDIQTMRVMATTSGAPVDTTVRLRELTINAPKLSIEGTKRAPGRLRWIWWTTGVVILGILIALVVRHMRSSPETREG